MNTEKFTLYDAVVGIADVRHIVAIMYGTTDLSFIKAVLNKSGYPFGKPEKWADNMRVVHRDYVKAGYDIKKVNGFGGQVDPFNEIEDILDN